MDFDVIDAAIRKTIEREKERVDQVCAMVDANPCERGTIEELATLIRHGYKFIDIRVRKDAKEYVFQADWIHRLFYV